MSSPSRDASRKPSSWSRGPRPGETDDEPAESSERGGELLEQAREQAEEISSRLNRGLRRASRALAAPPPDDLRSLLGRVDLPAIGAEDPLGDLGQRLDREGDLWRGLALRAFARAVWADRFTQAVSVIAALGCVALAAVAAAGALFGAGNAPARALLVAAGGVVLVAGATLVAWTSAGVRRAQRAIAHEANSRADVAELRLHRVGIVMAARQVDPELYRGALSRLEQDALAPPG